MLVVAVVGAGEGSRWYRFETVPYPRSYVRLRALLPEAAIIRGREVGKIVEAARLSVIEGLEGSVNEEASFYVRLGGRRYILGPRSTWVLASSEEEARERLEDLKRRLAGRERRGE